MAKRVYRLRALLDHAGACPWWRDHVRSFGTADEVLAWVQAHAAWRREQDGAGAIPWPIAREVRWMAAQVANGLAVRAYGSVELWRWRAERDRWLLARCDRPTPLTDDEIVRFRELWVAYADAYGLVEVTP